MQDSGIAPYYLVASSQNSDAAVRPVQCLLLCRHPDAKRVAVANRHSLCCCYIQPDAAVAPVFSG
jgi:hypothetical protein